MSEQTEHTVNSPTESSQRPAPQEILGQAGRRGPFRYGERIQVTDQENFESVFLDMGRILFHPLIAGLVLTAVLAAIMSTMSSQLVVCSSALVEDLVNLTGRKASDKALLVYGRVGVLVVALVGLVLALDPDSAILELVAFAWAGFGAAFGPIVLLSLYWRRLTASGAIAGMVVGAVTVFVWGNIDSLSDRLYEIVPGFALNLLVAVVVSLVTPSTDPEIQAEFERMEH